MPTVLRLAGYRFYFYSHEPNEPPHVHVDKAEATAKVWLREVGIAKQRGFRSRERNANPEHRGRASGGDAGGLA
ncbi:MAG TPA: DUF4160 domain-containing protein [Allosphingosinicella sp.]|nr:DUF4160 domain-containing protein [Allosphingosinicella sp.]